MSRTIEQPAPGYVPLRIPQGWILLWLTTAQDGTLRDVMPAVDTSGHISIWPKRDGRKLAVRASWGLQRESERDAQLEAQAAEIERLKHQLRELQSHDVSGDVSVAPPILAAIS